MEQSQAEKEMQERIEQDRARVRQEVIKLAQTQGYINPWFNFPEPNTHKIFVKDNVIHQKRTLDNDEIVATPFGDIEGKAGYTLVSDGSGLVTIHEPGRYEQYYTDNPDGTCTNVKFSVTYEAKLADHDGEIETLYGAKVPYTSGVHYIVWTTQAVGRTQGCKFWVIDKNSFALIYTPHPQVV